MMGRDKAQAWRPCGWGAGGLGMEAVTRVVLDLRGRMSRSRERGRAGAEEDHGIGVHGFPS